MRILRCAILLWILLAQPLLPSNGQSQGRGTGAENRFRVDYGGVKGDPELDLIKAAMDRQIQMVMEAGLPDDILTFFKRVPVTIVVGKQKFAGEYVRKARRIKIAGELLLKLRKPTLLHEFLHAYHDQRLPKGFENPKIISYYERAKELGAYAPDSHMMLNNKEFFASAGTAYLFGVTALEPHTREKVQENQPVFYKYLQGLFGPDAGHYKGSLNERIEVLKQAKTEDAFTEKNGE